MFFYKPVEAMLFLKYHDDAIRDIACASFDLL
jgi:hypothetical protein